MTGTLFLAPVDVPATAPAVDGRHLGDPDVYHRFHWPAVAAGMDWFDKFDPHWIDDIDENRLDVGSADDCPLGQLLGDFFAVDLELGQAVELGFVARRALRPPVDNADRPEAWAHWSREIDREHAQLTEVWRTAIAERRAR